MTASSGVTMLVASRRPPIPTSQMAKSTCSAANRTSAMAGGDFKVGGAVPIDIRIDNGPDLVRCFCKPLFLHRFSIDPEALFQTRQMRRGVKSRFVSAGAQSVFQQCADRSFSVASRDMNEFQFLLRSTQPVRQFPHPVESELHVEKADAVQPRKVAHDRSVPGFFSRGFRTSPEE